MSNIKNIALKAKLPKKSLTHASNFGFSQRERGGKEHLNMHTLAYLRMYLTVAMQLCAQQLRSNTYFFPIEVIVFKRMENYM